MRNTRLKRLAVIGVAGAALASGALFAVTGSAGATSSPTTTTAPSCTTHDDPWPAWVQGVPANIDPLTAAGVYMWHDSNGWHIRVTHKTDSLRTFSGQLITSGTFANVTSVKLEAGDTLGVSANHHTISFLFTNYGHIDGLNFFTHCAPSIAFAFQSDGVTVPGKKVTIGHLGLHPAGDPFTIARTTPPPTTTTTTTTTTTGPTP
jgi:hypothetical protein